MVHNDCQQQQQQNSTTLLQSNNTTMTSSSSSSPLSPSSSISSTIAPPSTSLHSFSTTQASGCMTEFIQKAEFHANGFASVARLVEDLAVKRFQQNASKGRDALESVVAKVLDEARSVEMRTLEVVDGIRSIAVEGTEKAAEVVGEVASEAAASAKATSSKWFKW
jgi:hypothetical protein